MLTQLDLDEIMQSIQAGKDTYLYYVAHKIEARSGFLQEHKYKSVSDFKVIKVKVTDVQNAYFEYLDYKKNPKNYHVEEELEYYDPVTEYKHYYTVKNGSDKYTKDLNPRIPSIIYGYRRKVYVNNELKQDYADPSPVKEVYTNSPSYGSLTGSSLNSALSNHKLDWKYMTLSNKQIVDGIEYKYLTSDWYILTLDNFPTVEKPLVNVDQYSSYFRTLTEAFYYIDQLIA
jgi:hypothetical protein